MNAKMITSDLERILSWALVTEQTEKNLEKLLEDTKKSYSLILQLCEGDKEKAQSWMINENSYFSYKAPLNLIFSGESASVMEFLKKKAKM